MAGANGSSFDEERDEIRPEERRPPEMPEEFRHLPELERAQGLTLQRMFAEQEFDLRQNYADWIIRVLGVQLFVADAVFVVLAWAGWNWELSSGVIEVWLAATVVQVVGVVAIVTRNLFPNRDGNEASA
jgi:hypothetical protein